MYMKRQTNQCVQQEKRKIIAYCMYTHICAILYMYCTLYSKFPEERKTKDDLNAT